MVRRCKVRRESIKLAFAPRLPSFGSPLWQKTLQMPYGFVPIQIASAHGWNNREARAGAVPEAATCTL